MLSCYRLEACVPTVLVLVCHDHCYVAQMLVRAADDKNPIEKAQEAVKVWHSSTRCSSQFCRPTFVVLPQNLGDEIKSNAESTAEKTEDAYQQANPEDNEEKPPTETYRSTELKNSKEKYTPKSDPKK